DVIGLLDCHRYTEQRAPFAAIQRLVRRGCGRACPVEVAHDDGIDMRVQRLDARDRLVDQFDRRNLARRKRRDQILRSAICHLPISPVASRQYRSVFYQNAPYRRDARRRGCCGRQNTVSLTQVLSHAFPLWQPPQPYPTPSGGACPGGALTSHWARGVAAGGGAPKWAVPKGRRSISCSLQKAEVV